VVALGRHIGLPLHGNYESLIRVATLRGPYIGFTLSVCLRGAQPKSGWTRQPGCWPGSRADNTS